MFAACAVDADLEHRRSVGVGSAGRRARYSLVRMSASDVAVVRRVYDALEGLAGLHNPNFDRIAEECFAPEYAFAFARPGGTGLEPEYRGLEGFREALDTWMEGWEWWETTVEDTGYTLAGVEAVKRRTYQLRPNTTGRANGASCPGGAIGRRPPSEAVHGIALAGRSTGTGQNWDAR